MRLFTSLHINVVKTEEICWGRVGGHSAPVYFPRKYTGEECWAHLVPVYFRQFLIMFVFHLIWKGKRVATVCRRCLEGGNPPRYSSTGTVLRNRAAIRGRNRTAHTCPRSMLGNSFGARLFQSLTHFIRVNHASSGLAVQKSNSNLVI